ncbi:hypothetical protein SKAU_G00138580 [Synaphobranchus kaupii]|uniref:Uncharacterized protein n=1 Tax=Synaphobranchus kaupii TaxID=118154 RepID=A0A9Q1J1Y0_SYNKA|nr:hypothetical protein SKAU_G00138580 [Synaphobranchus kaupii]
MLRVQEEVLKRKRAKLALMETQVDVTERQYEWPAISVPILLPNEQGASSKCLEMDTASARRLCPGVFKWSPAHFCGIP